MDGGDWARSRALVVPRDTCRAANVRMRAQMSKEGGGVLGMYQERLAMPLAKGADSRHLERHPGAGSFPLKSASRDHSNSSAPPQHDPRGLLPAESAC